MPKISLESRLHQQVRIWTLIASHSQALLAAFPGVGRIGVPAAPAYALSRAASMPTRGETDEA